MANTYPFITKSQITAQLDRESDFVMDCTRVMQLRHNARLSGVSSHGGWMASHARVGGQLAAKFASGEVTTGDIGKARKLLHRYVKQIASHFRVEQIRTNPELTEAARLFGVGVGVGVGVATPAAPAPPAVVVSEAVPATNTAEPAFVPPEPPIALGARTQEEQYRDQETAENDATSPSPGTETQEAQEDETILAVSALLRNEPDQRSEEIAFSLGVSTAMLAPTLYAMVAMGTLEKTGSGRGTRYRIVD